MHDIKAIRADPEAFDAGLRRRGSNLEVSDVLGIYASQNTFRRTAEAKTSEQNEFGSI